MGTSPGVDLYTPVNSAWATATADVIGLANGTAYYFAVTAVDAARKTRAASGEASATAERRSS